MGRSKHHGSMSGVGSSLRILAMSGGMLENRTLKRTSVNIKFKMATHKQMQQAWTVLSELLSG